MQRSLAGHYLPVKLRKFINCGCLLWQKLIRKYSLLVKKEFIACKICRNILGPRISCQENNKLTPALLGLAAPDFLARISCQENNKLTLILLTLAAVMLMNPH